jgi:hypothetical protein
LSDGAFDFGNHAFDVGQNVVIPEAQHTVPVFSENRGSLRISCRVGGVLSTIDFDHEFQLVAGKVGNVGANAHLTSEVRIRQP